MSALGEGEIAREGRRILRKLTAPGARLLRRDDGAYEVALHDGAPPSQRLRVEAAVAAAFLARGWIAGGPISYALSDAGQGWFDRAVAGESPFAAQHQLRRRRVVTDAQGIDRLVTVNEAESPLDRLRQRGLIDAAQYDAGEKLRRDFTLAQLMPRLGTDLTQPFIPGRGGKRLEKTLSDTVIASKQRFARAMKAAGPGLSDLLFDVCCHLRGLEEAEKAKGWPQRSARVVLGIALERLAVHYGMRVTGRRRMRSWRMEEAS